MAFPVLNTTDVAAIMLMILIHPVFIFHLFLEDLAPLFFGSFGVYGICYV